MSIILFSRLFVLTSHHFDIIVWCRLLSSSCCMTTSLHTSSSTAVFSFSHFYILDIASERHLSSVYTNSLHTHIHRAYSRLPLHMMSWILTMNLWTMCYAEIRWNLEQVCDIWITPKGSFIWIKQAGVVSQSRFCLFCLSGLSALFL